MEPEVVADDAEEQIEVEKVPAPQPYNIVKSNARYGISDRVEAFECDTCCFCARLLLVTPRSQALRKDSLEILPLENRPWQDFIDYRISLQKKQWPPSRVHQIGFRQRIHASCSSIMSQEEYNELLAHCKDRIPIPEDTDAPGVDRDFDYLEVTRESGRLPLCEYCDGVLNDNYPGIAYPYRPKEKKYLHWKCYDMLWEERRVTTQLKKEAAALVGIAVK